MLVEVHLQILHHADALPHTGQSKCIITRFPSRSSIPPQSITTHHGEEPTEDAMNSAERRLLVAL